MSITRCRRLSCAAWAALAAATCCLASSLGWTRSLDIAPYPITSVWPAAVRFLRVDRGFPVTEKDEAAGYVLFDFTDGPKPCKGSIELIRATDREGRDATRIAISVPDLPRRYEQLLLDKFAAKLRDDQGPPAPAPPRKSNTPPPAPRPDAGPPASAPANPAP
jgi:hypothetical protein